MRTWSSSTRPFVWPSKWSGNLKRCVLLLSSEFFGVKVGVLVDDISFNNMSHITQILYYVPEDLDDLRQLNCFVIYKEIKHITIKDIRWNFPLPGEYHFRFQYVYQGQKCWLDLSNEKCQLPNVEGFIIVKALRKSWINNSSEEPQKK